MPDGQCQYVAALCQYVLGDSLLNPILTKHLYGNHNIVKNLPVNFEVDQDPEDTKRVSKSHGAIVVLGRHPIDESPLLPVTPEPFVVDGGHQAAVADGQGQQDGCPRHHLFQKAGGGGQGMLLLHQEKLASQPDETSVVVHHD